MLLAWCALALLCLQVHADPQETVLTLNTVRAVRRTADPFIGISVSPQILLNNHYGASTVRMLAALSPAVLRVGDEDSEKLAFRSSNGTLDAVVFSESQWAGLNRFASQAGLNLIFSVSPHSDWKRLFNSTRKLGFNPSWQLGYKLKKNESCQKLGLGLVELREVLNSFQLQHSSVLGPDFQVCDTCDYERQISDIFLEAGDLLSVVTLQLDPLESKEDEKLSKLFTTVERTTRKRPMKPGRFRNGLKKQIWVAEASGPEEGYSGDFSDALRWTLKMGVLAQVGVDSVLKRPTQLISPSPDYWVSLLHRRLVGPVVLGLRSSGARGLRAFAHCTASRPGAVVWGAHRGSAPAYLSFRLGARVDHAELFLLTRDTWEDAEMGSTLLNGELLHLSAEELPSLTGRQIALGRNTSITLPPESVFFIVLPLRAPACLLPPARLPSIELQRLPSVGKIPTSDLGKTPTSDLGKITTSDLLNAAVLQDPKHKEFDLEKGGLYDPAGKERQSRDNAKEDLETGSKLILESLKAHANAYDKPGGETEIGKLIDMTHAAIDNGGVADEPDISTQASLLKKVVSVHVESEESQDGIPAVTSMPAVPVENDDSPMIQTSSPVLNDDVDSDGPRQSGYEQDSKILTLSVIPPPEQGTDEADDSVLTMSYNLGQKRNQSGLSENIPTFGEIRESKITRIKRSDSKKPQIVEPPEAIRDSLLYKRIQFLRKNRNQTKTARGVESKQAHLPKDILYMNPTINNNKDYNHQISASMNQSIKTLQEKNKAASKIPITLKTNSSGSLHYHPGEFYETLGSLKVENVSLKDIEKADEEAIDLMIEKMQNNNSDGKVSGKSSSDELTGNKNGEITTENSAKYVKCDDEKSQKVTSESHDKGLYDNAKCTTLSDQNSKIEHSSQKIINDKKRTEQKVGKTLVINADSDNNKAIIASGMRAKRELGEIKNITTILFPDEEKNKTNDSVKPQIGMYVIDQSEGRKLFLEATVEEGCPEEGCNTELYENITTEPTKIEIAFKLKNKTEVAVEKDPNFFLLNNLVIDNSHDSPMKKKTYRNKPQNLNKNNIQKSLNENKRINENEISTPTSTSRVYIIELNENGTALKYNSMINKSIGKRAELNNSSDAVKCSKIPDGNEENYRNNQKTDSLLNLLFKFSPKLKPNTPDGTGLNNSYDSILENNHNLDKAEYSQESGKNIINGSATGFSGAISDSAQVVIELTGGNVHTTNNDGNYEKKDSLQTLLTKLSPALRPANTVEGINKNPSENSISENSNINFNAERPENSVKHAIDGNTNSFSDSILGSARIFPGRKMHTKNKADTGLLENLFQTSTSNIPEENQYPFNIQSPLKGSSSILVSKVAQVPTLPTLKPYFYDMTTEHSTHVLSSPLQKPKMHLHSSSPLVMPPTLHQMHLPEPPLSKVNIESRLHDVPLNRGTPSTLEMLIAKHREKLNALKLRLQQAKEKALEAKRNKVNSYHSANPHNMIKRSIFTLGGANRDREEKKIGFNFPGGKGIIKLLEDGVVKSSLPYETNFKHKTGQITNDDIVDASSEEFSLPQTTSKRQDSTLKISPRLNATLRRSQQIDNVQIEENLEIENLDSGSINLSEVTRLEKPVEQEEILRSKRKPRAIHYPCMRDLFFSDYDTEEQTKVLHNGINMDGKRSLQLPLGKNSPDKTVPAVEGGNKPTGSQLTINENRKLKVPDLKKELPKKSKRSIDGSLNNEEVKLLEILTNNIMTNDLGNVIPEISEGNENKLQTMIDETISKAVPGKSGLSRLYELAKEYQKNHPDSLELFATKNTDSDIIKELQESFDDMKLDMDVQDGSKEGPEEYELYLGPNAMDDLNINRETSSKPFLETNPGSDNSKKLQESFDEIKPDYFMGVQDGSKKGPEEYELPLGPNAMNDLNINKETSSKPFFGTNPSGDNLSSVVLQETEKESGSRDEAKQFIDSFIEKIELLMSDITSTVKHGLL